MEERKIFNNFLIQYTALMLVILVVSFSAFKYEEFRKQSVSFLQAKLISPVGKNYLIMIDERGNFSRESKETLNSVVYLLRNHDIFAQFFIANKGGFLSNLEIIQSFLEEKGAPKDSYYFFWSPQLKGDSTVKLRLVEEKEVL